VTVAAGKASRFTSAWCPHLRHVAITARTPFWRTFRKVMGGPGLLSSDHLRLTFPVHLVGRLILAEADENGVA
jgi:hypothetical protein